MGIFDKIKNALFEEEYVEVEEPRPKPSKKEKPKKETSSKPIAKKVVLPQRHDERVEKVEEEEIENDYEDYVPDRELLRDTNNLKFPMMEDRDFKMDDSYSSDYEPKIVKVIEDEEVRHEEKAPTKIYGKRVDHDSDNKKTDIYGIHKSDIVSNQHSGAYEKKEDRTYFKPSPIISPIYGILDKNYKKEEIVSKREVRITSSYSRENLNVDDVRQKAFGSLTDDIANGTIEEKHEESNIEEDVNLLVDLSNDQEKPEVREITMGDAEEYFQDLGLEYNIDYKDVSREQKDENVGKHVKLDQSDDDNSDVEEDVNVHSYNDLEETSDDSSDNDEEDNLFDLIDSMYDRDN